MLEPVERTQTFYVATYQIDYFVVRGCLISYGTHKFEIVIL
jgi:hypothetical protein